MKKILVLAVVALLAGCGQGNDTQQATAGQCMKDTDCKGDRICESGACIAPTESVLPGARPTTELADLAANEGPASAPAEPVAPAAAQATNVSGAEWVFGYGQGTSEYSINGGGVQLYIGCPTSYDDEQTNYSSIFVPEVDGAATYSEPFQLVINGQTFNGPIDAETVANSENLKRIMGLLRDHPFTVSIRGKTLSFPVANVKAIIPEPNSAEFDCHIKE